MTTPLIGLIVAGCVVLKCLEIWFVNPNHWTSPRHGYFMKFWAGITCAVTVFLSISLFAGTESVIARFAAALQAPQTVEAILIATLLGLVACAWIKTRRFRMRKLVARLHRQSVMNGIDLSRSLM